MEKFDPSKLLDNWFDYSFLLEAMEQWLLTHAHKVNTEGNLLNGHKYAKRAKTMALLLRRVLDDNYSDNSMLAHGVFVEWTFEPTGRGTRIIASINDQKAYEEAMKHADRMRKQDLEMFGKYFAKHISQLWD